jgi:adenosine kinase
MRVLVTGSIATDHLMTFPGSISAQILPSATDCVSLSFLVDELQIRFGGVAANIAVGMARLGAAPILAAAVGVDFAEYAARLEQAGVSTRFLHHSQTRHTSRFLCTTDQHGNQIASFYPGAMSEARDIPLASVIEQCGADLVVVAPNDPEAMLRHTDDCRRAGVAFAADPSQQIALLDGARLRQLVDGARYLFTNEYELALLCDKTDWTELDLVDRVSVVISTHGADGARLTSAGQAPITIPAIPGITVADPTGGGDAFRAGLLSGLIRDLSLETSAQIGCALASIVLAAVGPQDYELHPEELYLRMVGTYGPCAAREMVEALGLPVGARKG